MSIFQSEYVYPFGRFPHIILICFRFCRRLAEKGIKPNNINPGYKNSDAVSIGKTLLQQVMEANIETLEERLAEYRKHKAECQLLGREFRFAKGNGKALASQYTYRIDPSDNARRRENTHHTGRYVRFASSFYLSTLEYQAIQGFHWQLSVLS